MLELQTFAWHDLTCRVSRDFSCAISSCQVSSLGERSLPSSACCGGTGGGEGAGGGGNGGPDSGAGGFFGGCSERKKRKAVATTSPGPHSF